MASSSKSNVLHKWVREQKADPAHAFPGQGQLKPANGSLTTAQRKKVEALLNIGKKAVAGAKGRYRAAPDLDWDAFGLPR